jgi:uncharacterized protein YkwD
MKPLRNTVLVLILCVLSFLAGRAYKVPEKLPDRYNGPSNEVAERRVNEIRLEKGLPALFAHSKDDPKKEEAKARYKDICIDDKKEHKIPDSRKKTFTGEVIAWGPYSSVVETVNAFITSPTHYDIITGSDFTSMVAWGDKSCLVVLFW